MSGEREVVLRSVFGAWCPPGVTVRVGSGVFAPHPDSAGMLTWCADLVRRGSHPVVLDLCTGSGAIALALALANPRASAVAVDASPVAADCARRNAARLARRRGVRVEVRCGDATSAGVVADLAGSVDLVVANPPYLPDGAPVDPEVAAGVEPAALHGGADGLDVIRGVVTAAAAVLRPGGRLAVEHAAGQGPAVAGIAAAAEVFTAVTERGGPGGPGGFVTARRSGRAGAAAWDADGRDLSLSYL